MIRVLIVMLCYSQSTAQRLSHYEQASALLLIKYDSVRRPIKCIYDSCNKRTGARMHKLIVNHCYVPIHCYSSNLHGVRQCGYCHSCGLLNADAASVENGSVQRSARAVHWTRRVRAAVPTTCLFDILGSHVDAPARGCNADNAISVTAES